MYKKIYRNMCFLSALTLILASFMILSAAYSAFNEHIKNEMRSRVAAASLFFSENKNFPHAFAGIEKLSDDKKMRIYSSDKTIILGNITENKEHEAIIKKAVSAAETKGRADFEKYSYLGLKDFYCYAEKNSEGYIFCIFGTTVDFSETFAGVLFVIALMAALIHLLSFCLASRLTGNIVKPIENVYSFDNSSLDAVYDEIRPFIARIAAQNTEIKRQMEKVSSQKIRLQAITENMNEGLMVFDKNKRILTANNCICELFSTIESSVKHRELSAVTKNEKLAYALEDALTGRKSYLITEINEKTFQVFYSPVYEHEKINGVVMLLFDVSEKTEAENIRREFSANVSHELKTPLTTIHGYSQIINNGIAKPEDILNFTQKIEKESSRLITLIEDIIKLSSLDEGEGRYERQELSLKKIASEVCETLSDKAAEKNISMEISGGDTLIFANLSQITELIYNLCDNAIKYNKENGKVFISISPRQITVRDTGIGIAEEYYERIFERFFRVDKSRSKKVNGTGLGLSIVKHIAKVNDASINVRSKIGEGTEFTVTFSEKNI